MQTEPTTKKKSYLTTWNWVQQTSLTRIAQGTIHACAQIKAQDSAVKLYRDWQKQSVESILTGPPSDGRHRRFGGWWRGEAPSAAELSPCTLVRVAVLLPLVNGLGISSLGLGESLLLARKATGEEVPSACDKKATRYNNTVLIQILTTTVFVLICIIHLSLAGQPSCSLNLPAPCALSPDSSASCDTEL